MLQRLSISRNNAKKAVGRRVRYGLISLVLCVGILIGSCAFVLNAIALTHPIEAADEPVAETAAQPTDKAAQPEDTAPLRTMSRELAPTGEGEVSYTARLTDRSNDIGVSTEVGYADSPYTVDKTARYVSVTASEKNIGGTIRVTDKEALITYSHGLFDQQLWDGQKPFRITAADGKNGFDLRFTLNDFSMEDDAVPYGAVKIDHLTLTYSGVDSTKNFFGRGNKLVIGEGVTTTGDKEWRVYGGSAYLTGGEVFHSDGVPRDVLTNVVVADGSWNYVFGGGRGSTGRGTQVTIRDSANVANVYGGGEYRGGVGVQDAMSADDRINVYIEGGTVGNLWGGNQVNYHSGATKYPLPVNRDISIHVSGGSVGRLIAGSDCTDRSANTNDNLSESNITGDATVNITGGSVGSVAGDPNRKSATDRQIQGVTSLNVSASNTFSYVDLFDVVNITGNGSTPNSVVVTTNSKIGDSFNDGNLTFWGSENREGYVGRISVTDGAKLVLNSGGTINKEENDGTGFWIGEDEEDDRSLSTLAIDGDGAGITAAPGTSFTDGSNICGLRVHGEVQGYSTLAVTDTPIYSDGVNYYYYVVADSSVNGGKAFVEPDGADYIVCYRALDGGKIGWYLRERPTISVNNKLVRAGNTENVEMVMSVTMNTFGYEWSSTPADNRVDFQITKAAGTESPSSVNESISLAAMAGISDSGNFRSVSTSGVGGDHLVSFDYVIDSSTAYDPTYYTVEADYHVYADSYVNTAATANAARCVYAFGDDAVMTAYPYSAPAGSDTASLYVYLPDGVTGSLTVSENDGQFTFTNDSSTAAHLDEVSTVTSNYSTASVETANRHFGVTIGGDDLYSGVDETLSAAVSSFPCVVYSYKNLSVTDITQPNASGLNLHLTVSGLAMGGNAVGTGDPSADSSGELQIQTIGTYKITYQFRTRSNVNQLFIVKGPLSEATVDASGHLTSAFVLNKAPYESNYGETLSWPGDEISNSVSTDDGVLANVTAVQRTKTVCVNYQMVPNGEYMTIETTVGANRKTDPALDVINVAGQTYGGKAFSYWEIKKSSGGAVIAKCYDPWFSYCVMDSYYISPVFDGAKAPDSTPGITLTHLDYSRNRWTDENGDILASGETDLLYTDFEIAFSDGDNQIYGADSGYASGVVFELCGRLGASAVLDPNREYVYSDPAALKASIIGKATYYTTPNKSATDTEKTRSIQCSEIDTVNLSNKNRIEFAQYYRNAYTLDEGGEKTYEYPNYLIKATAYLIKDGEVTLSNSVYICFKEEAANLFSLGVTP